MTERANMNVKLLAAVTAVLLLVPAARAQDIVAQEVEKALAALNEAFAKGDAKAVATLMTDDHVAVTPSYGGPQTREEQLKSLADLKLEEYRPKAMKVRVLSRDAAVVRYELAMKGTYKGKAVA